MERPDRLLTVRDLAEYLGVPAPRSTSGGIAESGSADPSTQAQFGVERCRAALHVPAVLYEGSDDRRLNLPL